MASSLQERLAALEGVPNRVPRYSISQSEGEVVVQVSCPGARGDPRVQVEARAFGFVLDTYYLPLFLPGEVRGEVRVARAAEQGEWSITLHKQAPGLFPGLDTLQPEILPPEGIEALAQAGAAEPRAPSASAAADRDAAELLDRALRRENSTRTSAHQPGLVLTSDEEMRAVDAAREAEDKLLRALRTEAALGPSPAASAAAGPGTASATSKPTTSRSGPRFGYGLAQAFDDPLPPQLVQLSRVYELQARDPSALPLAQRDGMATAEEHKRWDPEYYMDGMVDSDGQVASLVTYELPPPTLTGEVSVAGSVSVPAWPSSETEGDDAWRTQVEYGSMLTSLLFAFAYDRRTTQGDPTVQSAWTISQLARPLTSFAPAAGAISSAATVPPTLLQHPLLPALLASFRRSLSTPLYRSYPLSCRVVQDVRAILQSGVRSALAALSSVRSIFLAAAGEGDEESGTVLRDQDPFLLVYVRVALDPLVALLRSEHGPALVHATAAHLSTQMADEDWGPERDTFKDQVGGLHQWDLLHLDALLADIN